MKTRWMFLVNAILAAAFFIMGIPIQAIVLTALLCLAMTLIFFPRDNFFDW
jgi:hypothetical protein